MFVDNESGPGVGGRRRGDGAVSSAHRLEHVRWHTPKGHTHLHICEFISWRLLGFPWSCSSTHTLENVRVV